MNINKCLELGETRYCFDNLNMLKDYEIKLNKVLKNESNGPSFQGYFSQSRIEDGLLFVGKFEVQKFGLDNGSSYFIVKVSIGHYPDDHRPFVHKSEFQIIENGSLIPMKLIGPEIHSEKGQYQTSLQIGPTGSLDFPKVFPLIEGDL